MPQLPKKILELAKKGSWKEIELPTDNPALNHAVTLQKSNLVEAITNNNYDLALRQAVFFKDKTIIPLLLPHVKNINGVSKKQSDRTALHFAAMHGLDDVVTILLDHGAYINMNDIIQDTPLNLACRNGHATTAALLAKKGAIVMPNKIKEGPELIIKNRNEEAKFKEFLDISLLTMTMKSALPFIELKNAILFPGNQEFPEDVLAKAKEILAHEKITKNYKIYTIPQLIALESKHCDNLSYYITKMCENNNLITSISKQQLDEYVGLAEMCASLKQELNVEFNVIFKDLKATDYFLKSNDKIEDIQLRTAGIKSTLYSKSTAGEVIFSKENLGCLFKKEPIPPIFAL